VNRHAAAAQSDNRPFPFASLTNLELLIVLV
jgi:hypothetical protein